MAWVEIAAILAALEITAGSGSRLVDLFTQGTPPQLDTIAAALEQGDLHTIQQAAHRLHDSTS